MFRCQFCGTSVAAGVPCSLVVTRRRTVAFPYRERAQRRRIEINGRRKNIMLDDPGGTGWQIVTEKRACPYCKNLKDKC